MRANGSQGSRWAPRPAATRSLRLPTSVLRIISPTDGVKDRLAATDPWGDHQALAQAVREAAHQAFDREDVARWLKAEGYARAFRAFLDRLPSTPRPPT
jgi:hypothetical protein